MVESLPHTMAQKHWHLFIFGFKIVDFEITIVGIKDLDKLNLVKLAYVGLVLGLSLFLLLLQMPQNMTLALKVVKSDSKITIKLC